MPSPDLEAKVREVLLAALNDGRIVSRDSAIAEMAPKLLKASQWLKAEAARKSRYG